MMIKEKTDTKNNRSTVYDKRLAIYALILLVRPSQYEVTETVQPPKSPGTRTDLVSRRLLNHLLLEVPSITIERIPEQVVIRENAIAGSVTQILVQNNHAGRNRCTDVE